MRGLIGHRCTYRKVFSRVVLINHSFFSVRIDTDFIDLYLCAYIYEPQNIEFCGGDYTGVVPPVPISNTEVKYTKADDSVMNAKVGSRHLRTQSKNCNNVAVFCCLT